MVATIDANPQAATSLAVLLRASDTRSVADGLHAESAVYGVLQAGAEFAAWRSSRPVRRREPPAGPVVGVTRSGDVLDVELRRPDVRNALDARLRDELADALLLAASDSTLRVELRGSGAAFCAGGDLDEFGQRDDPATAHLIRMSRNLGWLIHQIRDRIRVHAHGPCVGSGTELAAFAGSVIATPDATFALPEVTFGLIPGAGGTVSIPRRIGRQRTALLALARPADRRVDGARVGAGRPDRRCVTLSGPRGARSPQGARPKQSGAGSAPKGREPFPNAGGPPCPFSIPVSRRVATAVGATVAAVAVSSRSPGGHRERRLSRARGAVAEVDADGVVLGRPGRA